MKISFIGGIMLGRFVSDSFKAKPYDIISPVIQDKVRESDFDIANLESPIYYSRVGV